MSNLTFSEKAWQDYLYWQTQDKKDLETYKSAFTRYRAEWIFGNR